MVAPQDPGELFDVVRADGALTGITKTRAAVHRDGDWHRSVHVWVFGVGEGGEPFLLFQRRSHHKDTWPGRLDATVGGHYRAGESLADALRETEEEIGVAVSLDELRYLGVHVCANEAEPGILDRELQDVFLLRDDRPLTAYRPHPVELAGLVRLPVRDLLGLFAGDIASVAGKSIAPGNALTEPALVTQDDFIPNIDRYFYRVAIAARLALRGEAHVAV
jgi:isopentenyldiphosphate isomerase